MRRTARQQREFRAAQSRRVRVRWERYHAALDGEPIRRDGPMLPIRVGAGAGELTFGVRRVPGRRRLQVCDERGTPAGFYTTLQIGRAVAAYLDVWTPGWRSV